MSARTWTRLLLSVAGASLIAVVVIPYVRTIGAGEGHHAPSCLSQVKQLALGGLMYMGDWNDRLPPALGWMDSIKPYHKNQDLEVCPEVAKSKGAYGYAFNSALDLKPVSDFPKLESTPLIYDSVSNWRNATDPFASLPKPGRHGKDKRYNFVSYLEGNAKAMFTIPAP
ncbi:MAG: hypothetical protein WAO58_10075 [Fimbriimonadaceae bacterium]